MRTTLVTGIGLVVIANALSGCGAVAKGAAVAGEEAVASGGIKVLAKELSGKAVEGIAAGVSHAAAATAAEHMMEKKQSHGMTESSMVKFPSFGSRIPEGSLEPASNLAAPKNDELIIAEIKMAIKAADTAEMLAQRYLDPSHLAEYFSGEALKEEINRVDLIRMNGRTRNSECVNLKFDNFKVSSDGKSAQVHVIETWRSQSIDASGNVTGTPVEHDIPQVEFLTKSESGWRISAFLMD